MHVSRIITYPPFNADHLEDRHIVSHALNVERHVPNRTEIMVPTCSYRMGVAKMGYGWAIFGMFNQYLCAYEYGRNLRENQLKFPKESSMVTKRRTQSQGLSMAAACLF